MFRDNAPEPCSETMQHNHVQRKCNRIMFRDNTPLSCPGATAGTFNKKIEAEQTVNNSTRLMLLL